VHQRLGPDAVRTGKRVQQVDGASVAGVRIETSDAFTGHVEQWQGDVYVAADGIRSASRASIIGKDIPLASNDWVMYRGATHHPPFLGGSTMVIVGDETLRVVIYPLDGKTLNWLLVRPRAQGEALGELGNWNRPVDATSVAAHVADWRFGWLDIPRLVRETIHVYEYPMADIDPLPRWSVHRATLLGDAAHAMYPFGSNGASQAILDARVLAYQLATHSTDAAEWLRQYEKHRREQVSAVQLANRRQAGDVMAQVGALARSHALDQAKETLQSVERNYKQLAGFDVDTLNQRASWSVTT
jgi:2-polyprenyl-6-methoxyphenol hydroxylase-like FAD-dependent oxidoreductase